jgi:peroxiredoxin family protein
MHAAKLDRLADSNELAELRARLERLEREVRAQQTDYGLSVLVFSGELDRLLAAFTTAVGAAACGQRASMFFTFWGAAALKKHGAQAAGKTFVERMFGWLLPGGMHRRRLSRLDMGGIGRAIIGREMRRKQIADLPQLIAMAAESGVEIYFCEMSMDLMGIRAEELIDYPGARACGVAHFIDLAARSRSTLVI